MGGSARPICVRDLWARRHASTLRGRLAAGETLVCAEGYLFELERRGYIQAGPYVPTCVLEHPEAVMALHRDFMHCGSDVVEAFTYYAHREKLRLVGFEDRIEELNRKALQLAKVVAAEQPGTLVAGNLSNSNLWVPGIPEVQAEARMMFKEQVCWAKEAGVDFIIAETFNHTEEALCALEEIKAADLPAVVTLVVHREGLMLDADPNGDRCPVKALVRLKEAGADVVGFNCGRGPATMLPLLRQAAKCADLQGVPLAALPVGYRTTEACPTMQRLCPAEHLYTDADPFVCTRYEFADFAKEAVSLGVRYIGTCCGGAPHHVRAICEALGKNCPAGRYTPDVKSHFAFGLNPEIKGEEDFSGITSFVESDDRVKAYYAKMHDLM